MIQLSNLQYANQANTLINMTVDGWLSSPIPYTYNPDDHSPLSVVVKGMLDGGGYVIAPYAPPVPPVPQLISKRQFYQQAAVQGVITEADALAAIKTGTIPGPLAAMVAQLPADQQFAANMLLAGATTFDRHHPLVAVVQAGFGWTDAQVDAFWIAAAML